MTVRLRLALWYAAATATIAMVPYLAVILRDTGLDDRAVALSMAALPAGTLLGGPLWSLVADRTRSPRRVLLVATGAATATALALSTTRSGVVMGLLLLGFAIARSPMFAIADATAVRALPDRDRGYGRVRLWGSVAFLLLAWAFGMLRETAPRIPLWIGAGTMALTVVATLGLPLQDRADLRLRPATVALRGLLEQRVLIPLVATCLLHGIGLAAYDHLYSLHVERMGLPGWVVGTAIALGVGVEVLVMAIAPRLLTRIRATTLLWVGVAVGIPRWWLTGTLTDPIAQIAVQSLHGLSFGAFWVAGVALFARHAPRGLENATQSLLPAATFGAGYLASMGIAAWLLPLGTPAGLFRAMAGVAVLATAGATIVAAWPTAASRSSF